MDREWDDEKRDRFIAMINAHPELHGIHELRTRTSGGHDFAQFQICLDPAMTVAQSAIHEVGVILRRLSDDAFDLYVYRGFALSFWQWLCEAAEECGYRVEPPGSA